MQKTQSESVWADEAPQRLSWSGLVQKLSSSNSIDSESEHSGTDDGSDTGRLNMIFIYLFVYLVSLDYWLFLCTQALSHLHIL